MAVKVTQFHCYRGTLIDDPRYNNIPGIRINFHVLAKSYNKNVRDRTPI